MPDKKVAIVGCADSKILAPYNDLSWEIWGINNLYVNGGIPRWNRWFEIHTITFDGQNYWRRGDTNFRGMPVNKYMEGLASLDCLVYMQKKWEIIPKSVEYPIQEILMKFGNYFTNSISYEIALAIMEGATEIGVWGVDMATNKWHTGAGTEYAHQRPSCEYFLGLAAGLGIKVYVPAEADLLKTNFLYGFQEMEQTAWEKKLDSMSMSMQQRLHQAEQAMNLERKKMDQYIGALELLKEVKRIRE